MWNKSVYRNLFNENFDRILIEFYARIQWDTRSEIVNLTSDNEE